MKPLSWKRPHVERSDDSGKMGPQKLAAGESFEGALKLGPQKLAAAESSVRTCEMKLEVRPLNGQHSGCHSCHSIGFHWSRI